MLAVWNTIKHGLGAEEGMWHDTIEPLIDRLIAYECSDGLKKTEGKGNGNGNGNK